MCHIIIGGYSGNLLQHNLLNLYIYIVWANFTLGSNSVKGKARPNILYEEI